MWRFVECFNTELFSRSKWTAGLPDNGARPGPDLATRRDNRTFGRPTWRLPHFEPSTRTEPVHAVHAPLCLSLLAFISSSWKSVPRPSDCPGHTLHCQGRGTQHRASRSTFPRHWVTGCTVLRPRLSAAGSERRRLRSCAVQHQDWLTEIGQRVEY